MRNRIILFFIITVIISSPICISQTKNGPLNLLQENSLNLTGKNSYNFNWKLKDSSNTDIVGKTDECDLFLINRSSLKNIRLVALKGNLLTVEKEGIKWEINVQDINKIKFQGTSGFWVGAGIGAGISIVGGALLGLASADKGPPYALLYGLVCSIPTGLVGGLIGLITESDDELYEMGTGNPNAKLKRLKYIINKKTPGDFWQWQ